MIHLVSDMKTDQANCFFATAFLYRRICRGRGVNQCLGLVEVFLVVMSAEDLPSRFCRDGALLLSLATGETHRTGKTLLAGFRVERVRQNVIERTAVNVHLKARVGAVLIDQWPG